MHAYLLKLCFEPHSLSLRNYNVSTVHRFLRGEMRFVYTTLLDCEQLRVIQDLGVTHVIILDLAHINLAIAPYPNNWSE